MKCQICGEIHRPIEKQPQKALLYLHNRLKKQICKLRKQTCGKAQVSS